MVIKEKKLIAEANTLRKYNITRISKEFIKSAAFKVSIAKTGAPVGRGIKSPKEARRFSVRIGRGRRSPRPIVASLLRSAGSGLRNRPEIRRLAPRELFSGHRLVTRIGRVDVEIARIRAAHAGPPYILLRYGYGKHLRGIRNSSEKVGYLLRIDKPIA